jgi:hypothetical protein
MFAFVSSLEAMGAVQVSFGLVEIPEENCKKNILQLSECFLSTDLQFDFTSHFLKSSFQDFGIG